jgi:pimeloyl-ACP methyl ester carboxylesterase
LSNDAVVEFLGGTPTQVPDHYREADPVKLAIRAPQRIVYGSADEHVPPALSKDYLAVKKKSGESVQSLEIAGADHFDIVDPRGKVWTEVEKVVAESVG